MQFDSITSSKPEEDNEEMPQKELTVICKKCKINDPDECVECEYMRRADQKRELAAKEAEIDFHMGMEAQGTLEVRPFAEKN